MPNTCFDPSDLIIPAFDTNAETLELLINVHPGQVRILDYVVTCDHLPFRNREDVIRWCICFGLHSLLGPLPSAFVLLEAKMNIWQDERLERQQSVLGDSVAKYLAVGNKESARRLVALSVEEYCHIPNEYWRARWLSTLTVPIELLRQHGITLNTGKVVPLT